MFLIRSADCFRSRHWVRAIYCVSCISNVPRNYASTNGSRRSIVNMLGGSIDVRSELGKGTEVRVILPMLRAQGSETPVSTPGSVSTLDRPQDDSITMLRARAEETRIGLYGFKVESRDGDSNHSTSVNLQVEKSLLTYITNWYGIAVTASLDPSSADIIIIDEDQLSAFFAAYSSAHGTRGGPALVCLCSNTTRHWQSCSWEGGSGITEFVSKPFGPYKLARALRSCLDKLKFSVQETETLQVGGERTEQCSASRLGVVLSEFEKVTIESDDDGTLMNILDDGKVQTNGESINALLAIGIDSTDGEEPPDPQTDFPFPHIEGPLPSDSKATVASEESNLPRRKTVPLVPRVEVKHASAISQRGENASTSEPPKDSKIPETEPNQEKQPPRILLVDDNRINLRLLQTYMRKRHYNLVSSADDGGEAVRAFRQSEGYDIIFMGTSSRLLFPSCGQLPTAYQISPCLCSTASKPHARSARSKTIARLSRPRSKTVQRSSLL